MRRLAACKFFFSSRRRHTRFDCDWSSDVCSSDLVERLGRKNLPRSQGTELEIRERDLTASTLDRLEGCTQARVAQGHAVEANALVVTKEVRRSVQAYPVSGGEQNRFQHRAGRALAVGASDGEKHRRARPSEYVAHFRHAFQPELDGFRMNTLDVVEPLSEVPAGHEPANRDQFAGGACRCRSVRRFASLSRIWRRSTIISIAPFSSRNSAR